MSKKRTSKRSQKFLVILARTLATIVIIGVMLVLIPLSLPRFFGYQTFDIISESMEPELPIGSLIFVKPMDPHEVKTGDIIAFYSNAKVVSHRVVENNTFESKFITKGDANETIDVTATEYIDFIGLVVKHVPVLGTLGSYFSTSSGKLLMCELIVCAMLLFSVSSKIKI